MAFESSTSKSSARPAPFAAGRWVFLFTLSLYILFMGGEIKFGDGVVVYDVTSSIVQRGSLQLGREDLANHVLAHGSQKGWSYFGSGLSVVLTPFYVLGSAAAAPFGETAQRPVRKLFVLIGHAVVCALVVLVFFRFARSLAGDNKKALIAALVLAACTMLWDYSGYLTREPLVALGLLGCLFCLFRYGEKPGWAMPVAGGAAFVLMTWTRFETWVLLPFLLLYLFAMAAKGRTFSKEPLQVVKPLLAFLIVPALSVPVFLYFNSLKFGHPLSFGYPNHSLTATPLGVGLRGLLASPMHGLIVFAPPVLAGLFALPALVKKNRALGAVTISILIFITVFYAKFGIWSGQFTMGPRFLVPLVPLMLLPLVLILDLRSLRPWGGAALVFLCAAGLIHQLLSVLGDWYVFFARYIDFFGKGGGVPHAGPVSFFAL